MYSPSVDGEVLVIIRLLVTLLSPSSLSVMMTPPTPATNAVKWGEIQVILGLGSPEAEQLKKAGSGAVTVTPSGC